MTHEIALAILACCGTAHLILAAVMGLYARYQIKYLSLAWIMGIFAFMLYGASALVATPMSEPIEMGILNPYLLLNLMVVTFLQSIFPLGIPMPAYLQMGRMWKYAVPVIVLLALYGVGWLLGSKPLTISNFSELRAHLLSSDVLLRVVVLGICIRYIVNIFRLPHTLTHVPFPGYLVGYSMVLGMSAIFYIAMSIIYSLQLAVSYVLVFTVLNLYLCFRTLESMALTLPKPVIEEVAEEPTVEEVQKAEDDFNEANLQRFHRVEYWMQQNRDAWKDNTFGRDKLVEETGYNRHLLLQCVRSQGYYNVHDYINSYRVTELKRLIEKGLVTNLTECQDAGFGTVKTVRTCFLKHEGMSVDDYLEKYSRKSK